MVKATGPILVQTVAGVRVAEEQRVRLGWGDCAENPVSRVSVHRTIPPGVSGYKSGGVEHAARRFRGLPENICISAVSTLVRSESDSLFLCYSNPEKARKPAFRLINPTATPFEREQRPDPAILPNSQPPAT